MDKTHKGTLEVKKKLFTNIYLDFASNNFYFTGEK